MKDVLFSSLSCEKMLAVLTEHTAPSKKETDSYVWIAPTDASNNGKKKKTGKKSSKSSRKKENADEWACLIGSWTGSSFQGKLYRSYKGQLSGGIALPRLRLTAQTAGNLGQLKFQTGFSISLWLFILAVVVLTLLQIFYIIAALPAIPIVGIVVLILWLALCAMIYAMFYGQYKHECQAVNLTLRTMIRAFD